MRILFLCHGNINRSAAGEVILKYLQPDWNVKSAALKDTKGGEITTLKMRTALAERGFPTDGIRSTPVSQELVDWADVIFYMDKPNEEKLIAKFGEQVLDKSILLSQLVNIPKVPDPAFAKGTELHLHVIDIIRASLEKFIQNKSS